MYDAYVKPEVDRCADSTWDVCDVCVTYIYVTCDIPSDIRTPIDWDVCGVWVTYIYVIYVTSHVTHTSYTGGVVAVLCVQTQRTISHIHGSLGETCHTYEWVMSHIRMYYITHVNVSCHTYEWVTSHISISHATHTNALCHTYEWVMSHIWMRHVIHRVCRRGSLHAHPTSHATHE